MQVGGLFGADIRPTRIFLWLGRGHAERVIALGGAPRPLLRPRPQRALSLGPVRLWTLGSPALTLTQAALSALCGPAEPERPSLAADPSARSRPRITRPG